MDNYERVRVEELIPTNRELAGLWKEHLDFEYRLAEFDDRPHLSTVEEGERKQLPKLKLVGKDRIVVVLAQRSN